MDKETYNKAKEIIDKIEKIKGNIKHVENTDEIYYKTPDMDGGYTPGKYYGFDEESKGDIKEAIKGYYQSIINSLNIQFERL